MRGIYVGYSLDTGRNVYLKPALASQGVKGSVTNALASAFVGSLGGGKSFANNLIVYYAVLYGAQAVIVDPKAERGRWKETLPEISHEINIVTLTSDEKNKGLLDPYVIMKNPKDSESLAIDILTFLTGISSRDGERFPILRKAIRAVTNSEVRGLMKVIEELRVENTPLSTSIADHIESFTDYDFAHLLFSNGYVEQSISLEKQLNIIQVADLVLPDKETSFEEYTTMELLSVAMLIVISTFALDFIHTDRSIFKIVDLDEAWSFLQVAQGKTLSMKLVRAGRAMNAGVYFVTQNTDDLLDEKLKNNLGLKFAFRSTDLNEIKKTLAFFGVDPEDENNQKRLRDLENGQCLISDLYGRVGVIQFHPVFEELLHAFDTRPPVRKRGVNVKPSIVNRIKSNWTLKRLGKVAMTVAFTLVIAIFLLAMLGTVVQAAGLVDDTINVANGYSRYPLENYQLDFYVDNSWGWLPWNWSDGIGKQVMYGLYAITNFIWTISLYVSNATGYLVQEAYSLDFISATADSIGKNMQTLAGVSANGFSTEGFYVGFLLLLILVLGVYVAYTGLIKRETTKAIHAIMNFVLVFILSASFIAYAPDYIKKSMTFHQTSVMPVYHLARRLSMPHSDSQGKDSVDLIRDSLFSIQVQQPWLLLQYNSSDIESIGIDRVESLLSTSPDSNNGEDREKIVAEEIEDRSNTNLTITKTINRLGTVFFLFVFNIGISIFVFLLTGIMIFSQVLFIIYAMFLPVSFILSMIPSFDGMSKRAITKLFNTILTRAGITLIITTAFSISTMLYTLSAGYPFFLIAFLQIVTFAGSTSSWAI